MSAPLALQLYSLREAIAAQGFETMVKQVAEMGYTGVETAGFPGTTAEAAGKLFKELGLAVPSAHIPMPLGDQKNMVLETMEAIGAKQITSASIGREPYQSIDGIKKAAERFNEANAVAQAHGYTFAIHNHSVEFQEVEGRNAHEVLLEYVDDSVLFQLDTYWIQVAGIEAVAMIKKFAGRAPTLHIKDGPCTHEDPMVALGQGSMDIPALVTAGGSHTEWVIVELDRVAPEVNMVEAVKQSADYMLSKGLAHGR